jgi:hypothetical protein
MFYCLTYSRNPIHEQTPPSFVNNNRIIIKYHVWLKLFTLIKLLCTNHYLLSVFVHNSTFLPRQSDYDKPRILPPDYTFVQPAGIRLELKQYQLDTVSWMSKLESRVDRGFTSSKLVLWEKVSIVHLLALL